MNCFPLTHACADADAAFGSRFDSLRSAIADTYRAQGVHPSARLDMECLFFIFWSVEIGMLNASTWWLDRFQAERRFTRSLRRCADTCLEPLLDLRELPSRYRARFSDVLRTIRNVYIAWDEKDGVRIPLTQKTTRLFLRYTLDAPKADSSELSATLHGLLSQQCRAYLSAMAAHAG